MPWMRPSRKDEKTTYVSSPIYNMIIKCIILSENYGTYSAFPHWILNSIFTCEFPPFLIPVRREWRRRIVHKKP